MSEHLPTPMGSWKAIQLVKNTDCCCDAGGDLSETLHVLKFQLTPVPPLSSLGAAKPRPWFDMLLPAYPGYRRMLVVK